MARLGRRRLLHVLHVLFSALVVLLVAACASPTLPLPPPAIPSIAPAGEGQYALRSEHGVEPNAVVVILNNNQTLPLNKRAAATLANAEGTWEQVVYASPGDVLDVTQEYGSMRSAQTTFRVPTR
ncbi:hypothetical protein [Pendulispora albinea]|uniref:Uncharacterized protein n=1 Tax=Pendulispora albinea TaxID=2741071 RepID=A0ABZ2LP50_9BACT